jgi:hypothetical protein
MSIPEQAGKVATSVIDGLKSNPSCLAALAVVALYGVLQYFESENQNRRMMDRTKEVGELLQTCLDERPLRRTRMPVSLRSDDLTKETPP